MQVKEAKGKGWAGNLMHTPTVNNLNRWRGRVKERGVGKTWCTKNKPQKAERKRERAVSGSGRYYRKRVGGRVRTTFLFSQNTGRKCRLRSLSSLSKELGRRQIFYAIHLSTAHGNSLISESTTLEWQEAWQQCLSYNKRCTLRVNAWLKMISQEIYNLVKRS